MTFRLVLTVLFLTLICLHFFPKSIAQGAIPELARNFETLMEIPDIRAISASEAHLYVLSGQEGLIVFRTGSTAPVWLYSSAGLAGRGNRLVSDIRFSYLFGTGRRLTVIEPTSVLGVYSSTYLPEDPNGVVRMDLDLFIADNRHGIRKISLESSESVDQDPESAFRHTRPMLAIAGISRQIFALDDENRLFIFDYEQGELSEAAEYRMPSGAHMIHTIDQRLYVTGNNGKVYRVRPDGRTDELFSIDEPVNDLKQWNRYYLIRGESGRLWITRQGLRPALFREDTTAGNFMATFKDQLWLAEHRQVSRWDDVNLTASHEESQTLILREDSGPERSDGEPLQILPIADQIIPYPRALILPLELSSSHDPASIRFQQRSAADGIRIRGNSFYWQPTSADIGNHAITIIAGSRDGQSDSTSFQVTVRPFNSPPRFTPVRRLSISVDEPFSIPFQARDPDGPDSGLIRYIGVDLPEGSRLDERQGLFEWTPSRRQAGGHTFQVIATDQFGAAASLDVTIDVMEVARGQ